MSADTSGATPRDYVNDIGKVLALRERNGGHLHHKHCIHNLPPNEQVTLRGKTVEWWETFIGPLPVQITPADWQIGSPWEANDD